MFHLTNINFEKSYLENFFNQKITVIGHNKDYAYYGTFS